MARRPRLQSGWYALSKRRREIGRANNEPCVLCGGPVDYSVDGRNPQGPTVEHLVPIAAGGSVIVPIDQLGIAHRHCQNQQGGRMSQRGYGSNVRPMISKSPVAGLEQPSNGIPASSPMSPPRHFSDSHPRARDTLGPSWRRWLSEEIGLDLRPWQVEVFDRALEIDADGKLCWREVVCSTPRQSGKSYLIYGLCMARAHHADHFGEPQECLHVANNVLAARRIHQKAWGWANQREGWAVFKVTGAERVVWPDGSHWSLSSIGSIWGRSASLAVVDEGWNVPIDVVDSALTPTQVERLQPQLWLFSTTNENPTALMLLHRKKALAGTADTMIAEWSADPESDLHDPAVWQAAAPHWTQARHDAMARDVDTSHFREQWLNIWPEANPQATWGAKWLALPLGSASFGGIAAVEVAFDRSCYGVACASTRDGVTSISASVCSTQAEALAWISNRHPMVLMAGANLVDRFAGPWIMKPCTVRQTRLASPWLKAAVLAGDLQHDHDSAVALQMTKVVMADGEQGATISARRSQGAVPTATAIAWAGAASAEEVRSQVAIW